MNTTAPKPTKKTARKILELLGHGLVSGLGTQEPGKMCVEAAVCFALGLPHGDDPKCVGYTVRRIKIALNDCRWSSNTARANGMRKIAIAQLGSDELDQRAFGELLAFKTGTRILPDILRDLSKSKYCLDSKALVEAAANLENAKTSDELALDALAARAALDALDALAALAARAALAALAARAARAARAALDVLDVLAALDALDALAALAALDALDALAARRDAFLNKMAVIILECLVEMKSPGCKWLDLCDE